MKFLSIVLLLFLGVFNRSQAQKDSVIINRNPINFEKINILRPVPNIIGGDVVVVLNNFIIRDTTKIKEIFNQLTEKDIKFKLYDREKGLKKFGLNSKAGILVGRIKKYLFIDFDNAKIIRY